jgi:hypothetical protein
MKIFIVNLQVITPSAEKRSRKEIGGDESSDDGLPPSYPNQNFRRDTYAFAATVYLTYYHVDDHVDDHFVSQAGGACAPSLSELLVEPDLLSEHRIMLPILPGNDILGCPSLVAATQCATMSSISVLMIKLA